MVGELGLSTLDRRSRLLVTGRAQAAGPAGRVYPNGELDTSFAENGTLHPAEYVNALARDAKGRIIVATRTDGEARLSRYTPTAPRWRVFLRRTLAVRAKSPPS